MPLTTDQVREHYEGLAFGEFSYGDQRAGFYPLFDEFIALIRPESQVYDIGCGAGFWLDEMVRRGVTDSQLFGIDLAPGNVQRAVQRGHRAACGSVLELNLPSDVADCTFCAGVIHHTPDPHRALGELVRITKPGGHIYLAVYNKMHPYFWLVHKATWPLRALHWRGWHRLSAAGYRLWSWAVQPVSYLAFGRSLDARTCRTLYMDQVLTPYAFLYSRRDVRREADSCGLDVVDMKYALWSLMIVAILRVRPKP